MRLVERIVSFRGDSRFSTWLYTMVLNACRDYRRRHRSVRVMQDGYAAFQTEDAADWSDSERKVRWLYLALDQLKPDLKETALLMPALPLRTDFDAKSCRLAAKCLGSHTQFRQEPHWAVLRLHCHIVW